ncbi:hypothetical protein ASE01_23250 [Nocardioides sp. Root190]|uniref:DUF5719 family protein n=1 Tax=Nocardioides sp. Root190 TaxID=1736488 RepID=UPI0006F91AEF|nr:DUF5719 family protein [Nocardioides sp. Root190]KRB79646.1 hypothetical protein ASE01_23250 [Nocardioides sp. Root190]
MSETASGGRRASTGRERRVDVLVGLAILLPALVAVSVGLIGSEDDPFGGPRLPTTAALTSATVVCPSGVTSGGSVRVTRVPEVPGGELSVGDDTITVEAGASVAVPAPDGPVVLDGQGRAAPGIAAGRDEPLAVPECRAPSYDEWLVGVGASARYATTIELVNPDDSDAVVDLALQGEDGPIEEPALRGLEVPANSTRQVDLAAVAPRTETTAAHLTVVRGRVTATARNTSDPLGRGRVTTDFLPADTEAATDSLILGVPAAPTQLMLHLANPGDDEVRVTTRLVSGEAVFTPTGAEEVDVAPHSMVSVDLTEVLSGDVAKGVVGIQVDSTGPVVSSAMGLVRGDLVLLAPAPELSDPAATVLPRGAKTLLLGGATRTGVVHVVSYDARGTVLADERVETGAGRADSLALPPGAVSVTVEARNTRIHAVVSIATGGRTPGLATVRVRPAELRAQIPVVVPE